MNINEKAKLFNQVKASHEHTPFDTILHRRSAASLIADPAKRKKVTSTCDSETWELLKDIAYSLDAQLCEVLEYAIVEFMNAHQENIKLIRRPPNLRIYKVSEAAKEQLSRMSSLPKTEQGEVNIFGIAREFRSTANMDKITSKVIAKNKEYMADIKESLTK